MVISRGLKPGERLPPEREFVGTEWRNLTIVRVHTDEGLTGLGEARMVEGRA